MNFIHNIYKKQYFSADKEFLNDSWSLFGIVIQNTNNNIQILICKLLILSQFSVKYVIFIVFD